MAGNPNAIVGGTSGIGGGLAVIELLDLFGVHVSGGLGAVIAGSAATLVLFVGRNGIQGAWRRIWKGKAGSPA